MVDKPRSSISPTSLTFQQLASDFLECHMHQQAHIVHPDVVFGIFICGSSLASQIIVMYVLFLYTAVDWILS